MQTRFGRLEGGPTDESGAVLIPSLLLLMVLTLIGVVALTNSRFELQLAAHDRAHKQALAAADVALSTAETVIDLGPTLPNLMKTPEQTMAVMASVNDRPGET